MRNSWLALMFGIAACGTQVGPPKQTGGTKAAAVTQKPELRSLAPLGAVQRPSDPGTQTIDLRLHGVAASGAFRLSPAAIEVSVDGSPVDAQLVPAEIDLGNENQAWRVATFGLPSSAQTVTIRLTLGAEGTLETGGNTQSVDLRGAPIFFQAVPSQLRTQNKVDVNVDLTRSIVAQNGGAVLLPVLLVQY